MILILKEIHLKKKFMGHKIKTLNEFIIERQSDFPYAKGELSRLLTHISLAAKVINREVNQAGLVDILGTTGDINIQGESVQKLDEFANEKFELALIGSAECCGIATEERQDIIRFDTNMAKDGKYIVCLDPLDGSSNIDVNVSIGTIFSIYRRISEKGTQAQLEDFMQKGTKQVAAGYVIYGSSTMMVYTTGRGVNGFTLDPSIGEFCLSHADIKTPKEGSIFSINEGYYSHFSEGIRKYINYCKEDDEETNRPFTSRYIGSLVADFHRNLLKGGIYMYPSTIKRPNGKLRLLYECNPLAMVIEEAGGEALTSSGERILDLQPKSIHQRVPLYIGSENMVNEVMEYVKEYK